MLKFRQFSMISRSLDTRLFIKKYGPAQTIPGRFIFWEKDRKSGYNSKEKITNLQHIRNGFKELKSELKLLREEVKEYFTSDPLLLARPGK